MSDAGELQLPRCDKAHARPRAGAIDRQPGRLARLRPDICGRVSGYWCLRPARAHDRLLLQPTSYLPAFDAALLQLVQALHDPVKHKIGGNECEYGEPSTRWGCVRWADARLCGIEGIIWTATLQPKNAAESPDRQDGVA